jgi:hypothetical protein
MPDDPAQQDAPTPFTTEGRLGGIRREALVADTGRANLAGIVREALIAGVGLAGRIRAQSSASGSVNTVFTGVTLAGTAAAKSAARAAGTFRTTLAGKITATSVGVAFIPIHITVAGRAATMARTRLAALGQNLVGGRIAVQAKARGQVNLSIVPISRQWGVIINTG